MRYPVVPGLCGMTITARLHAINIALMPKAWCTIHNVICCRVDRLHPSFGVWYNLLHKLFVYFQYISEIILLYSKWNYINPIEIKYLPCLHFVSVINSYVNRR